MFAGMTFFDAINHCMTAMATGGLSTHNDSIGYYNNVYIEIVVIWIIDCRMHYLFYRIMTFSQVR